MRLHALRVAGFGPFPDPVEVDFDAVCAAGLFLIHGATGAGKTSLLDAVCFAIFADVPGSRTRRGLVSDHAPEGTRPVVTLEFTSGGRRFRIERSPDYSRPKRRGSGTTRVPASVVLAERTGMGWRPLSTRHDEVADLLDQVLGMGLAQFAKVVVLPQGDVSAFLRASPEDRRALLERLFDISTYIDVEEWLVQERRRTAAVVEELAAALSREIDRLDDHAPDAGEQPWGETPSDRLPELLATLIGDLEREVGDLLAAADAATGTLSATARAAEVGRTLAAHRERGERAQARRTAELARCARIEELRVQVARALAADGLAGHLDGLEHAVRDEDSHLAELGGAAAGLGLTPETVDDGLVAELVDGVRDGDAVVSELAHLADELARAEALLDRARTTATSALAVLDSAVDRAEHAQAEVVGVGQRLTDLGGISTRLTSATQERAAVGERLGLLEELTSLRRARSETTSTLTDARERLLGAQQTVIDLRQRRLEGMAGELAMGLEPGQPCAVCGSTAHPDPASGASVVDAEEVLAWEARLEGFRTEVAELDRRAAAQLAREESLRDRLGPESEADPADLRRRRDELAATIEEAGRGMDEIATLEERLDAARTAAAAASARVAESSTAAAAASSSLRSATTARDDLVDRISSRATAHDDCPCGGGAADHDDVKAVVTRHRLFAAAVDRLRVCHGALADAQARRADREAAARHAAAERGFDGLDAARTARWPPATLDGHRAVIAEHEQTLAVTEATLTDPPVSVALTVDPPDLDALERAETRARRLVREAQAAHTAAETRLGVLRSILGPLAVLTDRLNSARTRAAEVKDLADAVSGVGGGNTLRMRLSSYVLAARLEKVVALANERLIRMDAGRYLLEHSDDRVAGSGRSGLDLRVLDQWTGRARATSSLSGGESFMVSLALALGLADAVREESGGVDLGTLFVDEGFGSLDDESLEQVLGVLDGLREGGRAVGVVSHVGDLRSRITHQVVVTKTATGSAVEVRAGA
ncbi:AAA family ATPase [Nostocoides sp. F2B08]|uniref:AAA family ATPase n=1 Tax=Nostocoides sp. F2B08 TaxID=2653936 RepID=UPI001263A987|nr:SMC family ATPase [Tetrasphaera sp. F2B08]KAB7743011.1 AAA family ATPase [Tetrasphaera sp. F2B08]